MDREGVPNESSVIPAELRGSTPRRISLTGTGWLNLLAAALFLAPEVPADNSSSLRQGDSLPIRYFPANPNINHPAAWEDPPYSTLWLLYLPAILAFIGLMFIRRFPVQRQLAMKGIAVRGSIEKTEWNGPSKGQRYANYTFRNVSNDEVEIGSCPSDYIYEADLHCWVLYLPTNPRRNEIYPFPIEFFRINQ
jgi:hypothetical protein